MAALATSECEDFLEFQDTLKKMRILDDKIIYVLNASIPTDSFKSKVNPTSTCQSLYYQLMESYESRENAIKRCISVTADRVRSLNEERLRSTDNVTLLKGLRKEQTKLRLLQSELNVEEVVRERSTKVYYERCRPFFKPPSLNM